MLRGKKLGLLLSCGPEKPGFHHALRLAQAALDGGLQVYLYCIDDAVNGLDAAALQCLNARGVSLFACAYGAQRRRIPLNERATFAGLSIVSDLLARTDRFVHFG